MPDKLGNAALIWSATSDASGQRVHLLQAPLRSIKAGHSMETFQRQSLDRSVLENVAIGDGSAELRGRVRYDHDPVGLSDAIVAGSQGKTLRYIPDLTDPDMDFQCDLVAPLAPFGLELDQQRGILGDQSVELVLRQTDQGSFDPLYHGSAVLFSYRAGGSLEASSSFGRVTSSSAPATFATISTDGGGFGTLSTALSNQGRIHWMTSPGSCGPREFPTLLLEDSREQLVTESEDMSVANWPNRDATAVTRSSEQADPSGGTAAWLIGDDSTALNEVMGIEVSMDDGAGPYGISIHMKQGETNAGTPSFQIRDVTAGAQRFAGDVTWSSGEPTLNVAAGATEGNPERLRDGWWRLRGLTTTSISTGNTHQFRVKPTNSADEVGDVYVLGAQAE